VPALPPIGDFAPARERLRSLPMKALTTFYRRAVVVVYPLDGMSAQHSSAGSLRVAELRYDEVQALRPLRADLSPALVQGRLARGQRCFVAWRQGRVVQMTWVATGRVAAPYLRRDLQLEESAAFLFDGYALPALRDRGVTTAVFGEIFGRLRGEGWLRGVAIIAAENAASLRVAWKLGGEFVGMYACLRFGPWQRDWQCQWGASPLPPLVRPVRCWNAPGDR
jgi:hypothetical protein